MCGDCGADAVIYSSASVIKFFESNNTFTAYGRSPPQRGSYDISLDLAFGTNDVLYPQSTLNMRIDVGVCNIRSFTAPTPENITYNLGGGQKYTLSIPNIYEFLPRCNYSMNFTSYLTDATYSENNALPDYIQWLGKDTYFTQEDGWYRPLLFKYAIENNDAELEGQHAYFKIVATVYDP